MIRARPTEAADQAPSPRAPRLEALDIVRAVAALAVILIHTSAAVLLTTPVGSRGFWVAGLANQGARFAVPAFVFLTGAGLFYAYGRRADFSTGQFYLRRLKSLGVPYLFWSLIYFTWDQVAAHTFSNLPARFAMALLTAGAIYTFYYFPIVTPFYLIFPLVRFLARSRWLNLVTLLAVLGNGLIAWFVFPHPKLPLGPFLSEVYPYASYTPFWWMGPFFLGAWAACRWDGVSAWLRRIWPGLLALGVGLLAWVMGEFRTYVAMGKLAYVATNFRPSAYWYGLVAILGLLGAGTAWAVHGSRVIKPVLSLGKYSFGIYLIHPLIMQVTGPLLGRLSIGPTVQFGLNIALILGGSYLAVRLIERLPGGGWLVGVK